jgi:hypothetical protein
MGKMEDCPEGKSAMGRRVEGLRPLAELTP